MLYSPQTLPVEQEGALLELKDSEAPPEIFEAKVESCFFTCPLPQVGQTTVFTALELRTSSSKGFLHSSQTNSKIGIYLPQYKILAAHVSYLPIIGCKNK
jgi:hypothetical protein